MTLVAIEKPVINFKKLTIEDHAVLRAKQRYSRKDANDALNFCKSLLGSAKYMGITTCDRGNKSHMFAASNKASIHLSLDLSRIITIIDIKDKAYIMYDKQPTIDNNKQITDSAAEKIISFENEITSKASDIPLQDKLIKLYETELRKYNRLEKKLMKELSIFRLEASVEIAQLNLIIFKTKSDAKKEESNLRIKEIEMDIKEKCLNLKKVEDYKRRISKVLVTLY